MIIDCISDLHGHYPKLEGGDLLIVAGDLTSHDSPRAWDIFFTWLNEIQLIYTKIIVIGGNHDRILTLGFNRFDFYENTEYLCDSGTEFEGLKIWGSPWVKKFPGMNPNAMAFTCDTEEELAEKWAMISDDTNILVTHGPIWGILDKNIHGENCGSKTLHNYGSKKIRPRLSVFGHIHESYGMVEMKNVYENINYIFVNASHVNERYEPVNKPVRVVL